MKKALLVTIALFISFLFGSLPVVGQQSLDHRLLQAAEAGDAAAIQLLLKKGAHIEAKDITGKTALFFAAATDVPGNQAIEMLLEKGANLEAKDSNGRTALIDAVQWDDRVATVRLLLGKGADIEATDNDGRTPLFWAASHSGETGMMRLLLGKGANIEAKNNNGETVLLEFAGAFFRTGQVRLLLEKGANIEAKNNDGETALLVAVRNSNVSAVQLLLEKGANTEVKNHVGKTPLIAGACITTGYRYDTRKPEIVKLLLGKGANIEVQDSEGDTALSCANRQGSAEIVDLLKQALGQRRQLEQARSKELQERFAAALRVLQQHPQDDSLRENAIGLAVTLPETPAIPEEARQLFSLASSQIKQASSPQALDQPIVLLRKALVIAPWWANAYYNLSRALELSGEYDEAARQLNYYLKLNPAEADAREARAHLVVIQTEKEAATQKPQ